MQQAQESFSHQHLLKCYLFITLLFPQVNVLEVFNLQISNVSM